MSKLKFQIDPTTLLIECETSDFKAGETVETDELVALHAHLERLLRRRERMEAFRDQETRRRGSP